MKIGIKKTISGTTIIEALTLLFIFSVITLTFYRVFTIGSTHIIDSKNRLGAVALLGEKMEIIRNLNYDQIGTDTGAVSGDIPEEEDVTANGRTYHVTTLVDYIQDSYDGVFPSDVAFNDYKKVEVIVSWGSSVGSGEVSESSFFVPDGLEVADPNSGILVVNVISDQDGGVGVSGASVHIVNSETGLDTTRTTDSDGNVFFMGDRVTNSIQKYQITVTKSGYETVATMNPYPTTSYNPTFVHASVVLGSVNVFSIIQNELADLTIETVDYLDQPVENIAFNLSGGKQLGTEVYDAEDPTPNGPIYDFDEDDSTDGNGEKQYLGISPGTYAFTLDSSVTDYEIIRNSVASPFALPSDPVMEYKIILADKDVASLLVRITNSTSGLPISGAQVRISNSGLGYDTTISSEYNGSAFFPTTSDPLLPETYDLEITADGYETNTSTVTINTNELKIENIALTSL